MPRPHRPLLRYCMISCGEYPFFFDVETLVTGKKTTAKNRSHKNSDITMDLLILLIYVPPHIHEKPYKKLYLRVLVS